MEAEAEEEGKKSGRIDWILVNPQRWRPANSTGELSKHRLVLLRQQNAT